MMLRRHRANKGKGQTKASDLTPKPEQDLTGLTVSELKDKAKDADIEGYSEMKKAELIEALQA